MRIRRDARDAGTVSIFVALSAMMMLLFIGIVLDCGGRLRATANADALAQEAARVGGQQIDQGALLGGRGFLIDTTAAYAAADAYLAPYGLHAEPPPPDQPPSASITITIDTTYDTALLGLFNTPTLSVQGKGTATLVHGVEKAGGA
ncbi:hypothetical protein P3T37_003007 [Kitasatospora sp. MAA4]|uniref:hypothetical protein n=1 Tax=Kitasatospora sp. MAA4 TaxID=3035093 RepID=UPI0024758F39|nr:hypothetical protein [Kitasatospora sp. MAA4]MDH6133611.1 hypothetical protein [Kitasatospora sp. MAA4]